jgi:hypothetical protein
VVDPAKQSSRDVTRLYGGNIILGATRIEEARACVHMSSDSERKQAIAFLKERIAEFLEHSNGLGLSELLQQQARRLLLHADNPTLSKDALVHLITEFQLNYIHELDESLFLIVPSDRKQFLLEPETWDGPTARFPDARTDMRCACQCFGLGQWTASVFHSMRVLERGLRAMTVALGGEHFAVSTDLENWRNIIDQIDKRIRAMETEPKSEQKSQRLEFCSQLAIQFRYFKDAWRNHVSHSRAHYDEDEARRVLIHVQDFMSHLSSGIG